jgi:hypothetical protein
MLPLLLALTLTAPTDAAPTVAAPYWYSILPETPVSDSPTFAPCHQVLAAMARNPRDRIADVRTTQSPYWGWILRARLTTTDRILTMTTQFTCWSPTGQSFEIFTRPDRLG